MQTKTCPHCGAAVPVGDSFCGVCGRAVDVEPAAVPVAPAPPPSTAATPAATSMVPPPAAPAAVAVAGTSAASPASSASPTSVAGTSGSITSRDNLAIGALVLGVINLCAWLFPICGLPLSIAGIALGAMSLNSSRRTLAIIGLGLCVLGLIASMVNGAAGVFLAISNQGR